MSPSTEARAVDRAILPQRSGIGWRKSLILNRSVLARGWSTAFPCHDFGTGRLRRSRVNTFLEECERAEIELAKRNPDPKTEQLRRLLRDDVSFETAWSELNDPRCRPTPQVVIEAIWLCVRERGVVALEEQVNKRRLSSCDPAARAELKRRIEKLRAPKAADSQNVRRSVEVGG
jgi:hypothetical protein